MLLTLELTNWFRIEMAISEMDNLQLQGGTAPEEGANRREERREEGAERESKEVRQPQTYHSVRNLREP